MKAYRRGECKRRCPMTRNFLIRILRPTVGLVVFVVMAGSLLSEDLRDWGKQLPAKQRFVILSDFNDQAVLDRETQLVWERFPGDTDGNGIVTVEDAVPFNAAAEICILKNVGGRLGWRLPAVTELATLLDPTQSDPRLPVGHPFIFCLSRCPSPGFRLFWTNTIQDHKPLVRYQLNINSSPAALFFGEDQLPQALVWCVRGPVAGPESH
jgi:hypothetical protein